MRDEFCTLMVTYGHIAISDESKSDIKKALHALKHAPDYYDAEKSSSSRESLSFSFSGKFNSRKRTLTWATVKLFEQE